MLQCYNATILQCRHATDAADASMPQDHNTGIKIITTTTATTTIIVIIIIINIIIVIT